MKRFISLSTVLALALFAGAHSTSARNQKSAAGHWEGVIEVRGVKLNFIADLSQKEGGAWSGTIAIPAQNIKNFSLSNVAVAGQAVSFEMAGIPGDPVFKGKFSEDGNTISGDLSQAGQTFPFTMGRKAEGGSSSGQGEYGPTPDKGVPGQGLEGVWQGTIDVPTASLRVVLKVTKAADGSFAGKMDSPDQGAGDLKIDKITFKDGALNFEMHDIGGYFDGKMSGDGSEISGEWQQGGGSMPLVFKRLKK